MKLIVFSDSHKAIEPMIRAVELEAPDAIVHLGDHFSDTGALKIRFPDIPLYAVRGNCDFAPSALGELTVTLSGVKLFMTHGHMYGVKSSLDRLITKALYLEADVVLYGHTHIRRSDYFRGVRFINPGSIGSSGAPYGILTLSNGTVSYEQK